MTGGGSRNGRWWPLLALPVLCCVGHLLLIAAGVAAVTGSVTGSTAVAAGGLLLAAAAMVVLLRRGADHLRPPTGVVPLPAPRWRSPMIPPLLLDLALAPVAGYLGTKAMEPVSLWMYERESQADREQEDAVRPGPPYRIAAQKTAALLRVDLSEPALDKAALVFHYGLAVSWAPTYALLRRRTGLGPVAAGLASGAAMSALIDEGLTPALGFSAPNGAYPVAAHVRGVVAHLAFGLAVATVTEAGWAVLRRRP